MLAFATTAIAALLNLVVLDAVPHVPDGFAYVFQARCFAAGMFATEALPVPEAFGLYLIDFVDERMFAVTNPGWPAVLAIGSAIGAEWLVNPVLGGISVLLLHALARRIAGLGTAHVLTTLLALSPWYLWINASFMTHSITLVLCLAGWLLVDLGRAWSTLLGGACMGLICLVRPLDGLAVGTLTGIWALGFGRTRLPFFAIGTYAIGCVAGAATLLGYNWAFTGDALFFPINDYLDRLWYAGANSIGFGADKGNPGGWNLDPLAGHGPVDVVYNANQNLYYLDFELVGWSVGALLPILLHLLRGKRAERFGPLDRAVFVYLVALVVAYSAYWYSGGSDFGARYWYPMIVPALWAFVRGLETIGALLGERFRTAPLRVAAVSAFSVLLGLAVFVPWRAVSKYHDYRGFHADFARLVSDGEITNELVLVEVADESEYGSAFVLNDPTWPEDRAIFAWDRDDETEAKLRAAFPGRELVRVRGRSSNGGETRIVR